MTLILQMNLSRNVAYTAHSNTMVAPRISAHVLVADKAAFLGDHTDALPIGKATPRYGELSTQSLWRPSSDTASRLPPLAVPLQALVINRPRPTRNALDYQIKGYWCLCLRHQAAAECLRGCVVDYLLDIGTRVSREQGAQPVEGGLVRDPLHEQLA